MGERRPVFHPCSAAAASRMLAQLFTHEPPSVKDVGDREVLAALQEALLRNWSKTQDAALAGSEVTRAAAEALVLASVRCHAVKWRLLRVLAQAPRFLEVIVAPTTDAA